MKTITTICTIAILLMTVMGCASGPSQSIKKARQELEPERRISILENGLAAASARNNQSEVLEIRAELTRVALTAEMLPTFKHHSMLLLADVNRLGVHRTTREQQTLASLGSIANDTKLATGVTATVKRAVRKLCMPSRDLTYADLLTQAERKMSEACYQLVTGDANKAHNLSLLGFELYRAAASSNKGPSIPAYVTNNSPGKSFLVRVTEARFCEDLKVFCR